MTTSKVTVNVRDEVLEDVRRLAAAEGKTLTALINEALQIRALAEDGELLLKEKGSDSQIKLLVL